MNINNSRFSFFQLLVGKNQDDCRYEISIPIIQRDYAQGRKTERANDVRNEFLKELLGYMAEPNICHDLDFVYGVSEYGIKNRKFIPLDGQQRLTTLFLLHWYLAKRVPESESGKKFLDAIKDKFSYKTRISSTDFCKELWKNIDLNRLLSEYNSIQEAFEDASWFAHSWSNDPTIKSMLVMLDAIHQKIDGKDYESMLNGLLDINNPTITFIFLDLNEYNLSDELYIKMNSRGKQLSSFENFKAKFEQHLKSVEDDCVFDDIKSRISSNPKYAHLKSVSNYFSFCIDTCWTDIFWKFCKDKGKDPAKQLDIYISNFFKAIFVCSSSRENLRFIKEDASDISFSQYSSRNILTPDSIVNIINALDSLKSCDISQLPLLKDIISGEYAYRDLLRFYAQLLYIIEFKKTDSEFLLWVTFINKLTYDDNRSNSILENNFINSLEYTKSTFKEMVKSGRSSIYDYLATKSHDFRIPTFENSQVKEELIKAHLYTLSDWSLILDIEQNIYFNAQVGFLFKLSGIVDYFNTHDNCSWSSVENSLYLSNFKKYATIANNIFNGGYKNRLPKAIFERAMVAVSGEDPKSSFLFKRGNFLNSVYESRYSRNLKRDFNWKRFFREYDSKTDIYIKLFDDIKKLFDQIDESKDIESEIQRIININTTPQNRCIVEFEWLNEICPYGFFTIREGHLIIHSSITFADDDKELYTYSFFNKYRSELSYYKTVNLREYGIPPHVVFSHKGVCFHMIHKSNALDCYLIKIERFPPECKDFLINLGFVGSDILTMEINGDVQALNLIKEIKKF